MTIVGDGSQSRDFVYVTDVANAFFKAALTNDIGERYNLGSGNPQKIKYLAELIKGDITYLPKRPGEPNSTHKKKKKITERLNWTPKIKFENGVKNMLENINYWQDAPLWDVEKINVATKTWFKYMSKEIK